MASAEREDVHRLQKFFEAPNGGVVDDPLIKVSGQICK